MRRLKKYKKAKIVDQIVKFCSLCKECWQRIENYNGHPVYEYYGKDAMPTIGKTRKECPRCQRRLK